MNVFHLYIFHRIHLVSIIFAGISVLIGIRVQDKKRLLVYRFMVSMLIVVLGHFIYEDFFTALYRHAGGRDEYTRRGIALYWSITVGLLASISIAHDKLRFLTVNKFTLCFGFTIFMFMASSLFVLWLNGFFVFLTPFYEGQGDPHGIIWAFSKFTGLLLWIPFIMDGVEGITY